MDLGWIAYTMFLSIFLLQMWRWLGLSWLLRHSIPMTTMLFNIFLDLGNDKFGKLSCWENHTKIKNGPSDSFQSCLIFKLQLWPLWQCTDRWLGRIGGFEVFFEKVKYLEVFFFNKDDDNSRSPPSENSLKHNAWPHLNWLKISEFLELKQLGCFQKTDTHQF